MKARLSGLYAVTPDLNDTTRLLEVVEAALRGGASLLQYRNKLATEDLRLEQASALLNLCRHHAVPLIINDFPELCSAVDADGVHLGGTDGEIAVARAQLGSDKIIGLSCYDRLDLAVAARHAGADYVAFGSCFGSNTKPEAVNASLELFGQARHRMDLPMVAIGGITAQNGKLAIDAGADALAVIAALFDVPDVQQAAQTFSNLFIQEPRELNPS